ncbi:MAG: glycosyltransferase [Candidatus Planktophila sp.]|nr:glycosyltransferase [Candidatus Planktophila sp.]
METPFGFVSTFPPTLCGIASFTASLMSAINEYQDCPSSVIALLEPGDIFPQGNVPPEVAGFLRQNDDYSLKLALKILNKNNIAIIQHEFGIYDGPDGDEVLKIASGTRIPLITILHTVMRDPTPGQFRVLTKLCELSTIVVVMSKTAQTHIINLYGIDPSKVRLLPHGAPEIPAVSLELPKAHPMILTWGLLGPGKGLELAISAMGLLKDMEPAPHYVVVGKTHPKVIAREGERYRESLEKLVRDSGLEEIVSFVPEYLERSEIIEHIARASIILLPYETTEQTTSGVLTEALAALKPIVSTEFPHAVELLSGGAGIVVPHNDPKAIARAIRSIIQDPAVVLKMQQKSREFAGELLWPVVAASYISLAHSLLTTQVSA